jgi:hypothetical protein
MRYELHHGDCLDVLKTLADCSVDAIVTDPPYGLGKAPDPVKVMTAWATQGYFEVQGKGFMGKKWDAFVPPPIVWKEVFRVLKPGGHLLAFAGTRTQDWMAMSLRFAGFEIRDMIFWCYGQGFPKSLDVSKAIDKAAGRIGESVIAIKREIRRRYELQGMTLAAFNAACGFEASGYLRESSTWGSVLPSADKWQAIKAILGCGDDLDALFAEAEREVVGFQARGNSVNTDFMSGGNDITAPATEAAQQWQGWGTALKPALEPITLARKPFPTTVAANVLTHGTGGLNIDGCRVDLNGDYKCRANGRPSQTGLPDNYEPAKANQPDTAGRWPANFILTYPEDSYKLRDNVSLEQLKQLLDWMHENHKH